MHNYQNIAFFISSLQPLRPGKARSARLPLLQGSTANLSFFGKNYSYAAVSVNTRNPVTDFNQ